MSLHLEEVMVYKVTYESMDDGHRLVDSWWSFNNIDKAELRSKELHNGAVVADTLYQDNFDNHFKVKLDSIDVDMPTKSEVLDKLPPRARKVLGY